MFLTACVQHLTERLRGSGGHDDTRVSNTLKRERKGRKQQKPTGLCETIVLYVHFTQAALVVHNSH